MKSILKTKKSIALLFSLALLLFVSVGGTLAYLIDTTQPVGNTFTSSKVTTAVVETLDGQTKKNVSIQNTGDTTAYIRAAVVVNWKDVDGNVYGQVPVAGTDYTITYALGNGWKQGADGFYYYIRPVQSVAEAPSDCSTQVLINSCSPVADRAPSGYYLNMEILCSGIQSQPEKVVTELWSEGVSGVSMVDDVPTLTIKE
ncbi:MAG: hypothetical protein E7293_06445 [Lachnospiraceae bacterium]|nr:hypothetical protein [Lachnospiraceae bacterium]